MTNWEGEGHEIEQQDEEEEEGSSRERERLIGTMMMNKVMTDEQIQVLRKQIAVYSTICHQLVQMHQSQQQQHHHFSGNMYYDHPPLMTHKFNTRQRWTPSPMQLQILEQIFQRGTGTPTKQKIKQITSQLCQHAPLSETNVYNWFQNRRARSKRKQTLIIAPPRPSQSPPPNEENKKTRTQNPTSQTHDMLCDQSDDTIFASSSLGQLSFYDNVMYTL